MANEIVVLEGDSGANYTLLMLFPIVAPVQVGGVNVVPTPSTGLSDLARSILAVDELADLDSGALGYRLITFRKDESLTTPQLVTRVREIYAASKAVFDAEYAKRYQHVGTRINAS